MRRRFEPAGRHSPAPDRVGEVQLRLDHREQEGDAAAIEEDQRRADGQYRQQAHLARAMASAVARDPSASDINPVSREGFWHPQRTAPAR